MSIHLLIFFCCSFRSNRHFSSFSNKTGFWLSSPDSYFSSIPGISESLGRFSNFPILLWISRHIASTTAILHSKETLLFWLILMAVWRICASISSNSVSTSSSGLAFPGTAFSINRMGVSWQTRSFAAAGQEKDNEYSLLFPYSSVWRGYLRHVLQSICSPRSFWRLHRPCSRNGQIPFWNFKLPVWKSTHRPNFSLRKPVSLL